MNPFSDEHSLGKFLAEYHQRLQSLGIDDHRIKMYTDALWSGGTREHALKAATQGLNLDESNHDFVADALENLPGPEEV